MQVITIKPHTPDGNRHYEIGETYQLSDASAKFMIAVGYVKEVKADDKTKPAKRPPTFDIA